MANRLIQKRLLLVQELEIVDDSVTVHIKSPFREETLSVFLTVLNPEPVITTSRLEFNSRVNGEPLISLYLGKPNAKEFNDFVSVLRERAQSAFEAFAGLRSAAGHGDPYQEPSDVPPEFDDGKAFGLTTVGGDVNVGEIDTSIRMLRTYLDNEDIEPLLSVLEAIKADPENESHLAELGGAFASVGAAQGAVLTYAPYVMVLLSDDPFGRKQS